MPIDLSVIGASGHAKVVLEALSVYMPDCNVTLVDQDDKKTGQLLLQRFPIVLLNDWRLLPDLFHIAIGNNKIRETLIKEALSHNKELLSIIHPEACVSPSALMDKGSFVAAKVIIGPESFIGSGCILNHGSVIDHDCKVGSYSHIAPNATLGGGVEIGVGCLIGAGSTILPGIKIGKYSVIGAGSVITTDVPEYKTVLGVPGRIIK